MPADMSSRNLVLILATSGFASSFSGRIVDPMLGIMAGGLGSSLATLALLSVAFALPYAFIQPIIGPIGDAVGKERVMQVCFALLIVALVGAAAAPNVETLFVTRAFAGAAAGGSVPLSLAMLGDRIPIGIRQVAMSRYLGSSISAQLVGTSLAGVLSELVGWRIVFVLAACLVALGLTTLLLGFRNIAPGRPFNLASAMQTYRSILANRRALSLFGLGFVNGASFFCVFPYVAAIIAGMGESGAAEVGLAIGGFAIGGIIFALLISHLLPRLGPARMPLLGGCVGAVAFVILGLATDWRVLGCGLIALGFAFNCLQNTFHTQVSEVAPTARASAVALNTFFFFLGQSAGVFLLGAGIEVIEVRTSLWIFAAITLVLGVIAARVIRAPA